MAGADPESFFAGGRGGGKILKFVSSMQRRGMQPAVRRVWEG